MVSLAVDRLGACDRGEAHTLSAMMATPKTTIQIDTFRSSRQ